MDVPEKYRYLKNNARICDPTASCRKKALSGVAAANLQGLGVQKGKEVSPRVIEDDGYEENDEEEQHNDGKGKEDDNDG